MRYAGFWMRFLAILIDSVAMGIVSAVLHAIFGFGGAFLTAGSGSRDAISTGMVMGMLAANSVMMFISLLYYWLMTGLTGATLGKMALGLRVVKSDGQIPGLGFAFLREVVGKTISAILIGIGFLWVAFDGRKQGLHDKVAGTFVVYTSSLQSAATGD